MKDGKALGQYVVFADGFAGAVKEPGAAAFRGSPVGADLTRGAWLWSDGSVAGIAQTIIQGVAAGGCMQPMYRLLPIDQARYSYTRQGI
jgi:hypothetical protein